jgi:hypothetical protein
MAINSRKILRTGSPYLLNLEFVHTWAAHMGCASSRKVTLGRSAHLKFAAKDPGDYAFRFSGNGNEVTQIISIVPADSPFSVFATKP